MQIFQDEQQIQLKKLCNFELGKEFLFKKLSIYEFLSHINDLNNHNSEIESKHSHKI